MSDQRTQACPGCGEPAGEADACPKCDCDLSALSDVQRRGAALKQHARHEYGRGHYRRAAVAATHLCTLDASTENLKLQACAQLLAGDFPAAFKTFRRVPR